MVSNKVQDFSRSIEKDDSSRDYRRSFFVIGAVALFLIAGSLSCGGPGYEKGMVHDETELRAPLRPPDQNPDRPDYWRVEPDIELYHFSVGNGPPILIVHGGPGIPVLKPWSGLSALTDSYRFIYYHQRGCGKSTRPIRRFDSGNFYRNMQELEKSLGLSAQLADIERIRRILGVEKLTLIGHSFGGFIASIYAAEFPERVDRLVLVSPAGVVRIPAPDGGLYKQMERLLAGSELEEDYRRYQEKRFDFRSVFEKDEQYLSELNFEFIRYYAAALKRGGLNSLPVEKITLGKEMLGGWVQTALFFSLGREADFRPFVRRIRIPVLLLTGDADLSPPESMNDYRDIPGLRFQVMSGAGHFLMNDQPEQFGGAIRSFLAD